MAQVDKRALGDYSEEVKSIAEMHGIDVGFVQWFFDNKKSGSGTMWFILLAAMWEARDYYEQRDDEFIAGASQGDMLALLDENETLEKRVAELSSELASIKAKALYWDADNTESSYDDPTDIAGALGLNPGDHFYVQVAYLDKDREYIVNDDGSVSCTQPVDSSAATAQKLREAKA